MLRRTGNAMVGPPRGESLTMNQQTSPDNTLPRAQALAERAFSTLEKFLHIEAFSGVVLLIAAAVALIWANSPLADSYHHLWHTTISFSFGSWTIAQSLHFLINDGLMTVFFLVVGMEIRREIHEGALANLKLAALPLSAAVGGVVAPALVYFAFNHTGIQAHGWAVPTATDIAFAVGVLALLGRSIPSNVRVFLLALAIIDDIVAVLIIAIFYSGGLDFSGFIIAAIGILMVLGLQRIGVASAYAYIIPGAVLWAGLLQTGAHPTLAGVVLGLMTPVIPTRMRERPMEIASKAFKDLLNRAEVGKPEPHDLAEPLKQLRQAQRNLLPPVSRVQMALHPWVAFGVMPIFALANAGVTLNGINLSADGSSIVMIGVLLALVLGKPLGIIGASWAVVRMRWCALPPGVSWGGVCLVGMLAGIGFTMSIFIATLAFADPNLLGAAKLGVLLASLGSAILGLAWGYVYIKRKRV
jgi:NhaA family Na+:H+ antiporter